MHLSNTPEEVPGWISFYGFHLPPEPLARAQYATLQEFKSRLVERLNSANQKFRFNDLNALETCRVDVDGEPAAEVAGSHYPERYYYDAIAHALADLGVEDVPAYGETIPQPKTRSLIGRFRDALTNIFPSVAPATRFDEYDGSPIDAQFETLAQRLKAFLERELVGHDS